MEKLNLIKITFVTLVLALCFGGFAYTLTSKIQSLDFAKTPENIPEAKDEIADYKNWTKVNDKPQIMQSITAQLCSDVRKQSLKDPHENKYVNVYVNRIGKDEMLTKLNPRFPVGTVIVKEKLSSPESKVPELLTVMIKRQKDFNPTVGDWEFLTFNGAATEVTSKGKLESCQTCHIGYQENDYLSRIYLSTEQWKKLK
jgi:hypothetical protein